MTHPIAFSGPDPLQPSSSSPGSELAEQAGFLRALARQLVRDDSLAEDLTQDTLLAGATSAAVREQLARRSSRPWLARVLRSKASNERRSRSRRAGREAASAREEAVASSLDTAGQLDLAERLLVHVRSLDPEVRDAVVARFYHDDSYAEIAARENAPVTTIQSRVARGLDVLRHRLDGDSSGGRAAWLGGLGAWAARGGKHTATEPMAPSVGVWGTMGPIWVAIGSVVLVAAVALGLSEPGGSPGVPGSTSPGFAQSDPEQPGSPNPTPHGRTAIALVAGESSSESVVPVTHEAPNSTADITQADDTAGGPTSGFFGPIEVAGEPTADAGSLEVRLPASMVQERTIEIAPSLADPNRELSPQPPPLIKLLVDGSGHGIAHGLPIGEPLCLFTNSSARAYTHQYHGVAYSLKDALANELDGAPVPIVIPESGTLKLELPAEIATYVDVTVLDEDGQPAQDSKVAAIGEWRVEEGAHNYMHMTPNHADGRFLIPLDFTDSPKPVLIRAIGKITPGPDFDPSDVPICAAVCLTSPHEIEEVTIRLTPSRRDHGRVLLPASDPGADSRLAWIERTLLGPPDQHGEPLALFRQSVNLGEVDAEGHFEWQAVPNGHYRVVARHPDFENVVLETEFNGESPPLELRFERRHPTTVTVQWLLPDEVNPASLCILNFGPSPTDTERRLLRSSRRSRTVPASPGRLWLRATTRQYPLTLSSRENGFVIVQPGANELTIRLEIDRVATGSIASEVSTAPLFLQVFTDEERAPLHVGTDPLGSPTEWVTVATDGRYRFQAPFGHYLIWTGTRAELRAGKPRTRRRVRFDARGLSSL